MAKFDIAWTGHEVAERGPEVLIISPKRDQRVRGVIYSSVQGGAFVHWDGSDNVPCLKRREDCVGCNEGWRRSWRGFLAARIERRSGIHLIEYTDETVKGIQQRLIGKAAAIRGCSFLLWRFQGRQRGRVILEIGDVPCMDMTGQPDPCIKTMLMQAWQEHLSPDPVPKTFPEDNPHDLIPLPGKARRA